MVCSMHRRQIAPESIAMHSGSDEQSAPLAGFGTQICSTSMHVSPTLQLSVLKQTRVRSPLQTLSGHPVRTELFSPTFDGLEVYNDYLDQLEFAVGIVRALAVGRVVPESDDPLLIGAREIGRHPRRHRPAHAAIDVL